MVKFILNNQQIPFFHFDIFGATCKITNRKILQANISSRKAIFLTGQSENHYFWLTTPLFHHFYQNQDITVLLIPKVVL